MKALFLDRARRDIGVVIANAGVMTPVRRPPAGAEIMNAGRMQPFVLSDEVTLAALEIAERSAAAVNAAQGHVLLPADETWIEWQSDTVTYGLSLHADPAAPDGDRLRLAQGSIFLEVGNPAQRDVLVQTYQATCDLRKGAQVLRFGNASENPIVDYRRVGPFLVAVLALMASPRVTDSVSKGTDLENKRRSRLNRPPISPHSAVILRDVDLVVGRTESARRDKVSEGLAPGGRAYHHVRTHLRLQRTGQSCRSPPALARRSRVGRGRAAPCGADGGRAGAPAVSTVSRPILRHLSGERHAAPWIAYHLLPRVSTLSPPRPTRRSPGALSPAFSPDADVSTLRWLAPPQSRAPEQPVTRGSA